MLKHNKFQKTNYWEPTNTTCTRFNYRNLQPQFEMVIISEIRGKNKLYGNLRMLHCMCHECFVEACVSLKHVNG